MLQGIQMGSQRGRKRTNDGSMRDASISSQAAVWLEKPKVPTEDEQDQKKKKKGKQPLQVTKLAMPGSCGSGMATLRGSTSTGSTSGSQGQAKAVQQRKDGNLNAFFLKPKDGNVTSSSSSTTKSKKTTMKPAKTRQKSVSNIVNKAAAVAPVRARGKDKGKDVSRIAAETLVPDSETEDDDHSDEQQRETLESLVSQHEMAEINLRSDKSDNTTIPLADQSTTSHLVLPPMPTPLPGLDELESFPEDPPATIQQQAALSIFGFGALAQEKVPTPPRTKPSSAKRRRVIETSSPVHASSPPAKQQRILASPSSQFSPLQTDFQLSDVEEVDEIIEPVPSHTASTSKPAYASEKRAGSRIPWDSDDDDERSRLNITHTASQIQRDLVAIRVKRNPPPIGPLSPRKLPTVQGETTTYMSKYRDESYSPVQYTWTESLANDMRGRFGMSPKIRKTRVVEKPKELESAVEEGRAEEELSKDEVVLDEHEPAASWFDESATEHSSFSQPVRLAPKPATTCKPIASAIDDSGFVPSSSSPPYSAPPLAPESRHGIDDQAMVDEIACIPSSQQEADSFADIEEDEEGNIAGPAEFPETFVAPKSTAAARRTRLDSNIIPLTGLVAYPETQGGHPHDDQEPDSIPDSQAVMMELEYSLEDSQLSLGESEEVENELLGKGKGRRILAPDTQEILDLETQGIEAEETQFPDHTSLGVGMKLGCAAAGEMETIPCSQEGILAPDSEESLLLEDLDPVGAETEPAELVSQQTRAKRSVGESISSAWFNDVIAEAKEAAAAARAAPQQCSIKSFFAAKPAVAGSRDAVAREDVSQKDALVRAVEVQMKERRLIRQQREKKVSFATADQAHRREKEQEAARELMEEGEGIADSDAENDDDDHTEVGVLAGETQFVPSSQTQSLDPGRRLAESISACETQEVADSDVDEGESRDLEEDFDVDQFLL